MKEKSESKKEKRALRSKVTSMLKRIKRKKVKRKDVENRLQRYLSQYNVNTGINSLKVPKCTTLDYDLRLQAKKSPIVILETSLRV